MNNRRERSFGSAQLTKSSVPLFPSVEKDYLVSIRGLILPFLAAFLESGVAAQRIPDGTKEHKVGSYPLLASCPSW
jgi:hypothetical protein